MFATILKITLLPTFGVALFTVLTTLTLDCATGVGVLLEVLLPGVGSASLAVMLAVLAYTPVALTVAVTVKVCDAPLAKLPIVQTPVPEI